MFSVEIIRANGGLLEGFGNIRKWLANSASDFTAPSPVYLLPAFFCVSDCCFSVEAPI